MAITSVVETHSGRDADKGDDGATLRRNFIVRTDSVRTAQASILADPRIPRRRAYYTNGEETNVFLVVSRVTPRQRENAPKVWDVEVEYETKKQDDNNDPNPINHAPIYTWATGQATEEFVVDAYDQKVENSIHEPFDPGLEAFKSYRTLVIERNEATFDAPALDEYVNTVNRYDIFGYDSYEGRMEAINGVSQNDVDYGAYWKVTYEIHFRLTSVWSPNILVAQLLPSGTFSGGNLPGPWSLYVRNQGSWYKKTSNCDPDAKRPLCKITPTGSDGLQDPKPVDLNSNGTKVSYGGSPFYLVFRPYESKNWSPLGLE